MSTGSITTSGLGSGIDIEALLEKMREAQDRPISFLNDKNTIYKGQISAYEVIQESINAFDLAVGALLDPGKYGAVSGTSSNTSIATMFAGKSADPGTYKLVVDKLAQAQKMASASYASNYQMGTGTLTINLGEVDASGNVTSPSKTTNITIGSTNNTMSGIRDAINASDAGVTATIVNDGTGDRLVLTSSETGKEMGFEVTVGGGFTGDLDQLAMNVVSPMTGQIVQAEAQNAEYNIDGIPMTSSSNEVGGNIKGISLVLKDVGSATLTVERTTESLKTAITEFVNAYNDMYSTYKEATKFVKEGGDDGQDLMGPLNGDSTLRNIMEQIRRSLTTSVSNSPGAVKTLADIGITVQQDGTLKVDDTKLDTALASGTANIEGLFRSTGNPSTKGVTFVSAVTNQKEGSYTYRLQRDSSGNITGKINGIDVTVTGNQVSAGGITLLFEEGQTNLEGTLYYTNGIASKLRNNIDGATNSSTGSLFKRVESLNKQIDDTNTRIEKMTSQIDVRMARMRDQLNKMDAYMAEMDSLSQFLTQQFAAMNKSSSK